MHLSDNFLFFGVTPVSRGRPPGSGRWVNHSFIFQWHPLRYHSLISYVFVDDYNYVVVLYGLHDVWWSHLHLVKSSAFIVTWFISLHHHRTLTELLCSCILCGWWNVAIWRFTVDTCGPLVVFSPRPRDVLSLPVTIDGCGGRSTFWEFIVAIMWCK